MSDLLDRDQDAKTNDDIFLEASERLKIADSAEGQDRGEAIEDLMFANGEQWPTDIKNERTLDQRPALTINHANTFVRRVVNNLKQQRPRIKCHPVGDGADIDMANVINGLIRHIENISQAEVAYDAGVESAVRIGWGYWRIASEYISSDSFDQELKILPIRNPFVVYIDPAAVMPDGSDMGWCIITEKMKRTEYKRKYPRADNAEWQSDGAGDQGLDWESKEELRLAEYFRICEEKDMLFKMSDGSVRYGSQMPSQQTLTAMGLTIAVGKDGKAIKRPTSRRQVEWYRLNGKQVIDKRIIPGEWIPVVRCEGNVIDINGQVRRKGMIRDLKDPARMYNYWRTSETERYALAPKAPWVMAEGQADGHPEWDDANQRSYSRLVYKPVETMGGSLLPPPQRQAPVQVEAGMAEAAQGAEHDLMAVAGMPHEPGQDSPGQVISGNAIRRRQAISDISHYQYFDNEVLAQSHTGRILLGQIPYYYDTQRMQRIIGDDGVPSMQEINAPETDENGAVTRVKNDLTIGRYDVVMDTGPGYQTKREEGAEAMLSLLSTPLGEQITKVGADLVVRNLDFAGADDLADRLVTTTPEGMQKAIEGLPKQAQTIVATMQQQVQQLQQANQHLQLELKYRGSIEEMKQQAQTERTHIQATTDDKNSRRDFQGWMHDIDVKSTTARDVAEIRVTGELLNTHVEAEHNKAAADRMIKQGERDSAKD
jgi:hypothetical protein